MSWVEDKWKTQHITILKSQLWNSQLSNYRITEKYPNKTTNMILPLLFDIRFTYSTLSFSWAKLRLAGH